LYFPVKKHILSCLIIVLLIPSLLQAKLVEFSIKDEAELGHKFNVLMQAKFPLIQDPVIVHYVRDLVDEIESTLPPQPFSIKVNVLKQDSINAFAAPAGYVFVHSGLIIELDSEDQLAAILAHELVHVSQRHLAHNIERSKYMSVAALAGLVAGALIGAGTGSEAGQALSIGTMAGIQSAALKYSRDDEREADQLGVRYLSESGFSPQGMLESFQKIKRQNLLSGRRNPPPYMSTHPGLEERLGYIEDLTDKYQHNKVSPKGKERYDRVKNLLLARYHDPESALSRYEQKEKDLTCLEMLSKAIILERLNNIEEARQYFERSGKCLQGDPLWYREMGWFFFKQGKFDQALDFINKSLSLNPKDYLATYMKGKILHQLGRLRQAETAFKSVLKHVPQDSDVHFALGKVLGRKGERFQGYLHYAYAYLYLNQAQKTDQFLQRAEELAKKEQEEELIKEFKQEYQERKKFW